MKSPKRVTPEQKVKMLELARLGIPDNRIAIRFGVHPATVSSIVRSMREKYPKEYPLCQI